MTENEFYVNICVDMYAYMYNRITGLSSGRIPICVYILWFCIYYHNTQLHTYIINLHIQACNFRIAQRKYTCIHVHVCVYTNTCVHYNQACSASWAFECRSVCGPPMITTRTKRSFRTSLYLSVPTTFTSSRLFCVCVRVCKRVRKCVRTHTHTYVQSYTWYWETIKL